MMEMTNERAGRTVSFSRAEQVHIVMPVDVNAGFSLFGGMLMQWIDVVAAVVARRHAGEDVLTAAVDHLEFLAPARLNDIVTLRGRVTFVGKTSLEVCVDSFVERWKGDGSCLHVNRAYLTMVAVGKDGKPTSVPPLICETDDERADFEAGRQRRETRKRTAKL